MLESTTAARTQGCAEMPVITVEHMVAGLHAGIAYTEKHNHVAGEQEHLCPAWIRSSRVTLGQSQMFVILVDPTL